MYELVVSPLLLAERRSVLRRKKFRPFLTLEHAEGDDYLIALARSVGAHVLASGDQDLLELDLADLRVVSPRAFLDALPGG